MNIRRMTEGDLDFCVERVTAEGWLSETRAVFESFLTHDPGGCFIAERNGRPLGMIVATPYTKSGFLGELIVVPEARGHGIGRDLMEHGIAYLRERGCIAIYLDGDTPAVPLYERLGFRTICRSLRFVGSCEPEGVQDVVAMTTDDLEAVLRIDRDEFGEDRGFFLREKFRRYPEFCFVGRRGDRIDGYLMALPGNDVITVGPWYSSGDSDDALALLKSMAAAAGSTRLRVGVLESNEGATGLMRGLNGFEETAASHRMVLGEDLSLGWSGRLYAVGSPATG